MDATQPDRDIAVITSLFSAHAEGRREAMLALVHPSAVWEPATNATRAFYLGKEGCFALFFDLAAAYGPFRVVCHDFNRIGADLLRVGGSLIRLPATNLRVVAFTIMVGICDGLIVRVVSEPLAPRPIELDNDPSG